MTIIISNSLLQLIMHDTSDLSEIVETMPQQARKLRKTVRQPFIALVMFAVCIQSIIIPVHGPVHGPVHSPESSLCTDPSHCEFIQRGQDKKVERRHHVLIEERNYEPNIILSYQLIISNEPTSGAH